MTDTSLKSNFVQQDANVFAQLSQSGHEQVVFCQDADSGLKAIIAIHNTILGPSLGGLRMWPYQDEQKALTDVLRLSRGMTYKSSIAGLNLGGGKAVIIGDHRSQKTEALLRTFAKFVENLNGKYITAEDVGMTAKDMEIIRQETSHVAGLPLELGGLGDPSPFTAYSTYMGMKAGAKLAWGSDSLEGKKVAVQGAGHVGFYLVELLVKEGAKVSICDIYEDRIKKVTQEFKVEVVGTEEIYGLDADIYAPCALGATVNDETLAQIKASVICGCANNQLKDEKKHGDACLQKGIIYAPDFLVNSGGVTNVYAEVVSSNSNWAKTKIEHVYEQTLQVIQTSQQSGVNAQQVAIEIAQNRIDAIAKVKVRY
jgi:leucine dehydrogenase